MAISKVTIDALTQMSERLRQSSESILSTKSDMDLQLNSFIWDDPVAIAFKNDYQERLKPITNKLVPNLQDYISYMKNLGGTIEEYTGGSSIHITGGDNIARVLPKGSIVDPIQIDSNAKVSIPDIPLEPINSDYTIPPTEAFSETWELTAGEEIKLDDEFTLEVVPIANGCGTESGFGHWAGQAGAGVDAYMNTSDKGPIIVAGAAMVGFAAAGVGGGLATLVGISEKGKVVNPDEFKRLNEQACAAHDICYVEGDKLTCDKNFSKDGGRFSSIFTTLFGGKAYESAQVEGADSKFYADKIEIETGKKIIVPEGYLLKLQRTKS